MTVIMRSISVGLRPASTSSSSSSSGCAASARASSRRFFPAMVSCAAGVAEPVVEADELRDLARHRAGARERQILAPEAGADRAILEHGQVGERLHDLVRARETVPRDAIRRLRR